MKNNDKYEKEQKELYDRICQLKDIDGTFEFDGCTITMPLYVAVFFTKDRRTNTKTR